MLEFDIQQYKKRGGVRFRTYPFILAFRLRQKSKGLFHIICTFLFRLMEVGSGCDIQTTKIGEGLWIPHLSGIIISYKAEIGDDCGIYQQVTIGEESINHPGMAPVIGNHVFIGAGAKIIGPITIGNNVMIGANAVVTKNIPDNCTVVGCNQIIKKNK